MLDVSRLRVLVAIARTGSVTAAAKELHYSQPSISHHLARLEAETGAQHPDRLRRLLDEPSYLVTGSPAGPGRAARAGAGGGAGGGRGRARRRGGGARAGGAPR